MNQVKAKIYYKISTGEVLVITSEMQGSVIKTTKEQDMKTYEQLKNKNASDINYIELPYGTLAPTFTNIKTYSINVVTKSLNCVYYTQVELDAQTLDRETEQSISDRISTITEYANLDTTSITDLENYILQREQDKITGGVS